MTSRSKKTPKNAAENIPAVVAVKPAKRQLSKKNIPVICLDSDSDDDCPGTKRASIEDERFMPSKCLSWFKSYAAAKVSDDRENVKKRRSKPPAVYEIDLEGIEKLYNTIGVDSGDIMALILAQKLAVTTLGQPITETQWMTLMTNINCDSDSKLKEHLPTFLQEMKTRSELLRLCQYAFSLVKKPSDKVIPKDLAIELFSMMLKTTWPLVFPLFAQFLESSDIRGMTLDTFSGLCDIASKYQTVESLQTYDATMAWPSLADDFVEWIKETWAVKPIEPMSEI